MKKRIVILLVLVLVGAGAWWFRTRLQSRDTGTFRLYGNVDIREVNLGFRVSGRLAQVLLDEGDPVKSGALLATLDDSPNRLEVAQAQAQVGALRARAQWLEAGNRPQEIAQARAVLREREVAAANSERSYKRLEELFAAKTASVQDRDDAEAQYREAEARLNSSREQLNLLEAGFRAEEIAQAKASLAQAEASLASAQLRLEDTQLKAPSDGVVLTRAQEPGAILQAGATVLTVSLKEPVWVRAYVNEPDMGRIHPGMKVQLLCDSRPNEPYAGHVGYISPRAEFTPKNVETAELRTSLVYRLRIVVENPDDGLRQGMPITVLPGK